MESCQKKLLLFLLPAMVIIFTCPREARAGCCCPTFWTAYNRHCYRLFSSQTTWQEAESFCNAFTLPSLGYGDADRDSLGHLVSIHSPAEHDFVVTLFDYSRIKLEGSSASLSHGVWLGLHDISSEGAFEWTDRSPFDFTMWSPGQPDNSGSAEDCGEIRADYGFKWNDEPCGSTNHYFVCKLPLW